MGGRGAKYTQARNIVGQYELELITDSKSKIVSFYSDVDKNGGIRLKDGKIKVSRDAMQKADELARTLSERMVQRDEQAMRDYRDIRQLLRGPFRMDDQDRSSIPDFNDYIRSRDNFLQIRRNGAASIDSAYQELASMYPQYFNAGRVTNPADQLQDINRVLRSLRDSTRQLPAEYRRESVADLRNDIIRGYITSKYA